MDRVQTPEKRSDRLDHRIYLLAFAIFATGTDAGVVAGMLPQIAQGFSHRNWASPASC